MDAQKILLANCYGLFTFFAAIIRFFFHSSDLETHRNFCLSPPELAMLPEEQSNSFPHTMPSGIFLPVFSLYCYLSHSFLVVLLSYFNEESRSWSWLFLTL